MIEVTNLKVCSLDVDAREISWSVQGSYEDPRDYTFEVLRSESPEGPFEVITPSFEDRYLFVDRRILVGDKFRKLWYRLCVTKKATQEQRETVSAAQQPDPDLVTNYIRRCEMTLFTQVIGRAVWLFKKRTFGARCRSCWDPTMHQRVRESCLDCFHFFCHQGSFE